MEPKIVRKLEVPMGQIGTIAQECRDTREALADFKRKQMISSM